YLRTVNSDMDFRWEQFVNTFFSRSAVPYWIAGFSVFLLLLVLIILLTNSIRKRRNRYHYKMKY
ncbi:MAG: hypothetical protein FWD01_03025, partial [Defluviitaleaceae bacterium]|nr:hypothetical protein [Defluviitaleaceae bacterium]